MSETMVSPMIKWILGLVVIIVVGLGLFLVFRDKIIGFLENLPTGAKLILNLIK